MTWSEEMRTIIRKEAPKPGQKFDIQDIYAYEDEQAARHPSNRHVRETLRDKLQEFRELGLIEFIDQEGTYRRLFEDPPSKSKAAR